MKGTVRKPARLPMTLIGTRPAGTCRACRADSAGPLVTHAAPAEGLTDPMTMCVWCTAAFYGHTMTTVRLALRIMRLPESKRAARFALLHPDVTIAGIPRPAN